MKIEGNSANNIVDANLNVSRGRIEELKKKKERTLDSSRSKLSGWSNKSAKSAGGFQKRSDILAESIEVLGSWTGEYMCFNWVFGVQKSGCDTEGISRCISQSAGTSSYSVVSEVQMSNHMDSKKGM